MAHLQPPPPPPPPGQRGPNQGAPFGMNPGAGNRGAPPPPPGAFAGRPGPPPPPPGAFAGRPGPGAGAGPGHGQAPPMHQPPLRMPRNSIQYVDITPRKPQTEEDCRKKLTTYLLYTIRKQPETKKDSLGTWAKAQIIQENLVQEDIAKTVKRLNDNSKSVAEKKAKLFPFQQQQVTRLLDDQINKETDNNFEWSLAQLDREEKINKQNKRETTVLSVYLKRTPIRDLSAVALFTAIDRMNSKKAEDLIRGDPPPPQPQPQQQPQAIPLGPAPGPQMGGGGRTGNGGRGRSTSRRSRHHRDDSSSDSESYDSEGSRSSYSSTQPSTVSSDSRGHRRRSFGRSYSRHRPEPRQHRITYGRFESPERLAPHPPPQPRPYVPEVPRAPVMPAPIQGIPAIDPMIQAYQAGKLDADAERYGFADRYPAERRYSPEPVRERYIDPRLQPRAVVTYAPAPVVPRRFDDRFEDRVVREEYGRFAPPRDEDYYRARERGAEEYIEIIRRPTRREPLYEDPYVRRDAQYRRHYYAPSDSWA